VITLISPLAGTNWSSDGPIPVSFHITDDSCIQDMEVRLLSTFANFLLQGNTQSGGMLIDELYNVPFTPAILAQPSVNDWTFNYSIPSTIMIGTMNYSVWARDCDGAQAQKNHDVTVSPGAGAQCGAFICKGGTPKCCQTCGDQCVAAGGACPPPC
jgi:hypothetical protein